MNPMNLFDPLLVGYIFLFLVLLEYILWQEWIGEWAGLGGEVVGRDPCFVPRKQPSLANGHFSNLKSCPPSSSLGT